MGNVEATDWTGRPREIDSLTNWAAQSQPKTLTPPDGFWHGRKRHESPRVAGSDALFALSPGRGPRPGTTGGGTPGAKRRGRWRPQPAAASGATAAPALYKCAPLPFDDAPQVLIAEGSQSHVSSFENSPLPFPPRCPLHPPLLQCRKGPFAISGRCRPMVSAHGDGAGSHCCRLCWLW